MARLDITAGRGAINALAENTAKMHAMYNQGMDNAFKNIAQAGDILTQWHLREDAKAFRDKEFAQKVANDERNFEESKRQYDEKFAYQKEQNEKNFLENQRQFNKSIALNAQKARADVANTNARTQALNLQNEQQQLQNTFWRRGLQEVQTNSAIPRVDKQGNPITQKTTFADFVLSKANNGEDLNASEQLVLNTMGLGGLSSGKINASGELETRSRSAKNKVLDEVRDLEKLLRSIDEIKKESPTAGLWNGTRRALFNVTGGAIGMNEKQDRLLATQRNFRDALMKTNFGGQLSKQKIDDIDNFFNKGFQSEETLNNFLDTLQTEILFAYENAGKKLADFKGSEQEVGEIHKNLENYKSKGVPQTQNNITRFKPKEKKKALNVEDYLMQ